MQKELEYLERKYDLATILKISHSSAIIRYIHRHDGIYSCFQNIHCIYQVPTSNLQIHKEDYTQHFSSQFFCEALHLLPVPGDAEGQPVPSTYVINCQEHNNNK